jgi:hypothetical protein
MKKFKTIEKLLEAVEAGEIPHGCVSPGGAAAMLGITRQSVNYRVHHSCTLEAWGAEGYVLISERSILAVKKKQQRNSGGEGELSDDD